MRFLYQFEAMTTPCEVSLFCDDKGKADRVAQLVLEEAKRLEQKYNYFAENSYLSQLNRRETDALDVETKELLRRAIQYYRLTGGVFDITVATIKDLYRDDNSLEALHKTKEKLLPFTGCEHLKIKKDRLSFDNPYTKIDLGGFVKEYAVDQAVKIVKKHKIQSALINFGGDIYAVGKKPEGQTFRVGIKNPQAPETFIQFVEIENEALTTSASYERHVSIDGERFSHIIDKGGKREKPSSVTVISGNCVQSGVYSTALMITPDMETNMRVIVV